MKLMPLSKLTLGELEEIEEYAGNEGLRLLMGRGRTTGKALVAWVWVSGRRDDSSYTVEQAREIHADDIEWPEIPSGDDDGEDPTSAAG